MRTTEQDRDRLAEMISIQERLAESRHNERFGWGAVVVSAFLVVALTIASRMPGAVASTLVVRGALLNGGMDIAAGLMYLAAMLVVLGAGVSLYCRFLRTRLFDELARAVEGIAGFESDGEEAEA